jgi:hypothetical protein
LSSAAGGYYFPPYSSEYFELQNIYDQDRKLKEKLNLPENSTIKYEKDVVKIVDMNTTITTHISGIVILKN